MPLLNRLVLAIALSVASPLPAHFLFIRIEPARNENGQSQAHVFFGEQATAGDPKFVDKIDRTKLWQTNADGRFEPLVINKLPDRLTANLIKTESGVVVGFCEYGVLMREVPFLLRYYPKAVVGNPRMLPQAAPRDTRAPEIMARFSEAGVTLSLFRDGRPVPEATFTTVDEDLRGEKLTADKSGSVTWKPPATGYFCVYASLVTKQAGEANGKSYIEIREFPTIAFPWSNP